MRNKLKPCNCGLLKVYSWGFTDEKNMKHSWVVCYKWVKD